MMIFMALMIFDDNTGLDGSHDYSSKKDLYGKGAD